MKQKKKKKGTGKVQGLAMLYGRSSKAIRIPNGGQSPIIELMKGKNRYAALVTRILRHFCHQRIC